MGGAAAGGAEAGEGAGAGRATGTGAPKNVTFLQMEVSFERSRVTPADAFAAAAGDGDGAPGGDAELFEDTVTPLFRLVRGAAASSYGLACARKGGVPRAVVQRAALVTKCMREHAPVPRLPPSGAPGAAARAARDFAAVELADLLMMDLELGPAHLAGERLERIVALLRAADG